MKDIDTAAKIVFDTLVQNAEGWKHSFRVMIRADDSERCKALIRGVIWFRGQVPDLDCVMGEKVFHAVGTYAAFVVSAPSCYDGNAGEGYRSSGADYICKWAGWDGATGYTVEPEELIRAAIATGHLEIIRC